MNYIVFNGTLIDKQEITIHPLNRAFAYGDGLFETIIVKDSQILYLNDHFERISSGLAILSINFPFKDNRSIFQKLVTEMLIKNNLKDARLKLHVWRKQGGYVIPESTDAEFLITMNALTPSIAVKENVVVSESVKLFPSLLSNYKTLNFLPYILAGLERKTKNCDDIIIMDYQGFVAEASTSNLFWTKDNTVFTPSLNTGCIKGVMRSQIINHCQKEGIPIVEGKFLIDELENADSVFTSNVSGLSLIKKINNTNINTQFTLYQSIRIGLDLL